MRAAFTLVGALTVVVLTQEAAIDRIVAELRRSGSGAPARRAALIALGNQPAPLRDDARAVAARLYAADPDPGVHSAAEWVLRRHGALAAQPALPGGEQGNRRWYVAPAGHTMVVLDTPATVSMGSPADEPGREPAPDSPPEPRHRVRIPRRVAIGTTEVTVAQFRRFLDARPEVRERHRYPESPARMAEVLARFSPDDDGPMIAVTWYEAAMYCNWLSAEAGLPPSDWVYPEGLLADGARLPPDHLSRIGYRLPTEAEWEHAARAGTDTPWFFGRDPARLGDYAWFARHPPQRRGDPVDPADPQRAARVGLLRPNDAGLFDVYGNVWEWTHGRVVRHDDGRVTVDGEDPDLVIRDADARTRRGGAFPYGAEAARSAGRGTRGSLPANRRDNVGFRVARTLPTASRTPAR